MTISLYTASIPVFKQMLTALSGVLTKAEAHATAKNIEPNALLQARLFPDMFQLVRQVQIAVDFAKGVSARLAEIEVPKYEDTEVTFADAAADTEAAASAALPWAEVQAEHFKMLRLAPLATSTPGPACLSGSNCKMLNAGTGRI